MLRTLLLTAALSTASFAHALTPDQWREDFAQLRAALAAGYANLDWVVAERRVDLKSLVARTGERLAAAKSDEDAARALKQFLDAFGDGHVRLLPPAKPANATPAPAGPATCASMGFRAPRNDQPIAFARAGDYQPLAGADSELLPAGVLTVNGRALGVIRVALFMEHAFPALCEKLKPEGDCDKACQQQLFTRAGKEITRVLARQVSALAAKKIDALVVDITGNGGGTNWAEAAARVVTGPGLKAPPVAFVRHPHWLKSLDDRARDVAKDLTRHTLTPAQRDWLMRARDHLAGTRALAEPCPRDAIWDNQRVCPLLVTGRLHTTGLDALPPALNLDGFEAEWVHFNLASYEAAPAWTGRLAVLVDGDTASAAELFAATLKDNGRATIIGAPTYGSGCGYTNGGIGLTLAHSQAVVKFPDCARFRADGSNEVAGMVPDILTHWRANDSPYQRAARAVGALGAWVSR